MAGVRVWRVAAIVFLSGCASKQVPIPLAPDAISKAGTRVGIVVAAPLPTADTTFPGADCLLCMAAANIANTSLTSHTKTLTNDDLAKIRDDFARAIRKKGATPILIAQPLTISELPESDRNGPNIARIDYRPLAKRLEIDKILVIHYQGLGMIRTYANYFPTSAPRGYVSGVGYLINLTDNTYEWYAPFMVQKAADGNGMKHRTFRA